MSECEDAAASPLARPLQTNNTTAADRLTISLGLLPERASSSIESHRCDHDPTTSKSVSFQRGRKEHAYRIRVRSSAWDEASISMMGRNMSYLCLRELCEGISTQDLRASQGIWMLNEVQDMPHESRRLQQSTSALHAGTRTGTSS